MNINNIIISSPSYFNCVPVATGVFAIIIVIILIMHFQQVYLFSDNAFAVKLTSFEEITVATKVIDINRLFHYFNENHFSLHTNPQS